jgi:hypothetical protein
MPSARGYTPRYLPSLPRPDDRTDGNHKDGKKMMTGIGTARVRQSGKIAPQVIKGGRGQRRASSSMGRVYRGSSHQHV